jgi:beta-carotene 3-hydroxylase
MILLNVCVVIGMAVFMEGVAWFTHKYVMHGFLWSLHRDHHRPKHRGLQKNDLFAAFFSLISMGVIASGAVSGMTLPISVGVGIALYGVGYFLFHDVMFHKRFRRFRLAPRGPYLRRIVHAHSIHHRNVEKKGQPPYSFLYAGPQYAVDAETRS